MSCRLLHGECLDQFLHCSPIIYQNRLLRKCSLALAVSSNHAMMGLGHTRIGLSVNTHISELHVTSLSLTRRWRFLLEVWRL
jgi:hypothetical protein